MLRREDDMNAPFILIVMVLMHITADFVLQGIMADLKQKKVCASYGPEYAHDWAIVLFMHSFMWAFMIMLPWAYMVGFNIDSIFVTVLFLNTMAHMVIDHAKCNMLKINMTMDQCLHIFQIIITMQVFMAVV